MNDPWAVYGHNRWRANKWILHKHRGVLHQIALPHLQCVPGDGTSRQSCARLAQFIEICDQHGWVIPATVQRSPALQG
ncbi:hypothetical protein GCM10027088_16100 [Nocardia goodfellowii]|uniref:Uncharacterized protein n=1 Tax=Nocardia goodfellowii TaxID=882446 RepID=A0ABS4QD32_9NOCA|nr:hypothetical protein [Nocardia goodfellowii]